MRYWIASVLVLSSILTANAQIRMKSCIGCMGNSITKGKHYHHSATGQVFEPIEVKDNYRSGFVFVAASRAGNMKPKYSVYPNPAIQEVSIKGNLKNCKIELMDMAGRVLHENEINTEEESYSLNVSEHAKGAYFILVHHPLFGVQSYKIIKL